MLDCRKRIGSAWVAVLSLSMTGGTSCCLVNGACTAAGCFDGLQVNLQIDPASTARVEVTDEDGQRRTIQCDQTPCLGVFFDGFHPNEATITVTVDGRTQTVTTEPDYETVRPNGRCCDPTCRSAIVDIAVPTPLSIGS